MLIHLEAILVHLISKLIEYSLPHKSKSLQIIFLCSSISTVHNRQISVLSELVGEKAK